MEAAGFEVIKVKRIEAVALVAHGADQKLYIPFRAFDRAGSDA